MTGKELGKNCIFKVGDGASPETFNKVSGQVDTKFAFAANAIDTTDKDSGTWGSSISGPKKATVTLQGEAVWPDTSGLEALRSAFDSGDEINGHAVFNSAGAYYAGSWCITALEIDAPTNDVTKYSITLMNAGALTWSSSGG